MTLIAFGLFSISAFVNKSLIKFVFKGLNLNFAQYNKFFKNKQIFKIFFKII